jgi:hypothetical protein
VPALEQGWLAERRKTVKAEKEEHSPKGCEEKPAENTLSDYYISTEGVLLGEFGSFLGQLANKIDEQLGKNDSQ